MPTTEATPPKEEPIKTFAEDIAEVIAEMPQDDGSIGGGPIDNITKAAKEAAPEPPDDPVEETDDAPPEETSVDTDQTEPTTESDADEGFTTLAARYGCEAEDLKSQFSTAKDAETALAMLDLQFRRDGQLPPEEPAKQAEPSPPASSDDLDISALKDLDESDPLRKTLESLVNHNKKLASEIQGFKQKAENERAQQVAEYFHSSIDRMETERYGKGNKLTASQQRNRSELAMQCNSYAAGLVRNGIGVPPMEELIRRMDNGLFSQAIAQEQIKKNHAKSQERSAGKLGSPKRSRGAVTQSDEPITESWQDDPVFQRIVRAVKSGNSR